MAQYVALLRGINVGGNAKVEMAKLRTVFESLGYEAVRTYINSGNVLFESSKDDFARIEPALVKAFGFPIRAIVRDAKNIHHLCQEISPQWTNDKEQRTDVVFLWNQYDNKKSLDLIQTNPDVDTLVYLPGAIVWHFDREYYAKSGMHKFIGTEVYKHMTARNINTLRKLDQLMHSSYNK